MISLKPGVRVVGAQPEIAIALTIAASIYEEFGHDCIVTSIVDGVHSVTSLHYCGSALDLRINHLSSNLAKQISEAIDEALGEDYDVILEADHIHLEYQPRKL